jgi:inner membrane protein
MMGRTHALLGFNCLWLLEGVGSASSILGGGSPLADAGRFTLCAIAVTLGSLLPDLDAPASLLQGVSLGGIRPVAPVAWMLHRQFGHRGFLHSLPALGLLAILTALIGGATGSFDFWIWLALCLGYLSHLLGDACTKSGVPLFWRIGAFRRRSIHILPRGFRLTTGSQVEEMVFAFLGAAALVLALRHMPGGFYGP